ncbi:MAG: hypothetical protein LW884_06015 [Bacteroidetes bacterium]|jgi:hypothetical protein|nr:hypothetical protein [Bacteroidota bacterium]
MKLKTLCLLLGLCPALLLGQPIVIEWEKSYGGSGSDELLDMDQTEDGGFILGGRSNSDSVGYGRGLSDKSEPGRGSLDYWAVRVDRDGNILWDKTLGGSDNDQLWTILSTVENGKQVFFLGGFSRSSISGDKSQDPYFSVYDNMDFWIVKTDDSAKKMWDKRLGGTRFDWLSNLKKTNDGGYMLAGFSSSPEFNLATNCCEKTQINFGTEYTTDFWISKVDQNFNIQWDKTFGGEIHEIFPLILQTQDNGYILAGSSNSDAYRQDPLHGKSQDSYDPKNQRGASCCFDYWIIKLDENGNRQWDKTYGGTGHDQLFSIVQTPDGGYLVGGHSYSLGYNNDTGCCDKSEDSKGLSDYWIVKLDETGNRQWDKTYGGTGPDFLKDIKITRDGGYVLLGISSSGIGGDKSESRKGDVDMWILKFDSNGNKQWDKTIGGGYTRVESEKFCILELHDGSYVLGGAYVSGAGDNSDKKINRGSADYWLVKIYDCKFATPTISQNGSLLRSSQAQTGNQWLDASLQPIPQATGSSYAPPASGTYYVQYSSPQGCVATSEPYTYIQGCDGQAEGFFDVRVFSSGHPGVSRISISTPQDVPVNRRNYTARLLDPLTGQVRYSTSFSGLHFELYYDSWPYILPRGPYTLVVVGELDTLTLGVQL